ncbi:hydrogenase maturation protein [Methylomicrobium sp. Wu6]|uniref:hydrogenase maturation protein n=1 Tax=Methylomicrobium sp. Wu6 TaxID=3107928 RepID=UPI002DD655B6|nr:hydrogenase maturation protein [Methylomicrobium sp. Wu6]MEC4747844.1 hydrogenase maturation protein [Methylomicrobium sp. Wu6]
MRILLISSSYNGLCQRAHVELEALGHDISITLALSPDDVRKGVTLFQPDVIICPFLKEKIPEDVWSKNHCFIIHPGIKGDRGPSSLDWAIMNEEQEWGVTVLQAVEDMDAGDIWASETFTMRPASKAGIYRRELTQAAIKAMLLAVKRVESGSYRPEPLDYSKPDVRGELRPLMKQHERRIDWEHDHVATILKKINAADSAPGVLDVIDGQEYYLYGAHEESMLQGWQPGAIIAQRHGAICRAAIDGAVWISHLKRKNIVKIPFYKRFLSHDKHFDFKLPAAKVLGSVLIDTPESPIDPLFTGTEATFKEIWYDEKNQVGYLHFNFHNGAMSTSQCRRLAESYRQALARQTKVLVLMGGSDFWSNGIHLNAIEAAENPANESWRNINAIDDFVYEILTTENKLTISAVWGGCGAGGAMAILAADKVWAREGVIFNPHYKTMGLYGSEYWTYSLPKRVGPVKALELTETPLPIGTKKAKAIGFIDEILSDHYDEFLLQIRQKAEALAADPQYPRLLEEKLKIRQKDERVKPLAAYRAAELQKMKINFSGKFYGGEVNYHEARYNFVHKVRPKETAAYLAKHMRLDAAKLSELRQPLAY